MKKYTVEFDSLSFSVPASAQCDAPVPVKFRDEAEIREYLYGQFREDWLDEFCTDGSGFYPGRLDRRTGTDVVLHSPDDITYIRDRGESESDKTYKTVDFEVAAWILYETISSSFEVEAESREDALKAAFKLYNEQTGSEEKEYPASTDRENSEWIKIDGSSKGLNEMSLV